MQFSYSYKYNHFFPINVQKTKLCAVALFHLKKGKASKLIINLLAFGLYPRSESNRDQRNRNPLFYPLNYRGGLFGTANIVNISEKLCKKRFFTSDSSLQILHFVQNDSFVQKDRGGSVGRQGKGKEREVVALLGFTDKLVDGFQERFHRIFGLNRSQSKEG